jgi:hypothetical protein
MKEPEARQRLDDAIHEYQHNVSAPGTPGSWVLITELSVLVDDPTTPLRHGYNYATSAGTSPAAAVGLLRIGAAYAETSTGLSGEDDE